MPMPDSGPQAGTDTEKIYGDAETQRACRAAVRWQRPRAVVSGRSFRIHESLDRGRNPASDAETRPTYTQLNHMTGLARRCGASGRCSAGILLILKPLGRIRTGQRSFAEQSGAKEERSIAKQCEAVRGNSFRFNPIDLKDSIRTI